MISRRVGRYEIDRLLGEGGVGRVYAAHDTLLGRRVAIKTLRPEASRNRDFIERFLNEAISFSDLRHPNITGLYDLDLEGQPPHMVMELIEGHTLEELLEWGAMPARECLAVIAQVTAGLSAAHRKGVIHRDIKPSNLMVTESGLLKIMDFGIARVRGSQRLTRADQVFATLLYASPEQLRGGEVDERSDIYNLAAVAYEILAGRPPFAADNDADLRTAQLELLPPPLAPLVPGTNPRIEAAILRALAKRPEDRFVTVEAFADAIGASTIRRDATDILQGYFTPLLRRVSESHETRLVSLPHDASAPPSAPTTISNEVVSLGGRTGARAAFRSREGPRSLWRPLAVLGAAVLAMVLAVAYVTFWSSPQSPKTPQEPETAVVEPPPPAKPPERPETPVIQPPPRPAQPPKGPEGPAAPVIQPPPPAPPQQPQEPKPPVAPPPSTPVPQPPPAPDPSTDPRHMRPPAEPPNPSPFNPPVPRTPPPKHPYPEGEPQLEGVVSNFGSAEWIFVNGQKVQLYGIEDNAKTPSELGNHQAVMAGYLRRGQTYVVCYQRPVNTYRCYADNANIADAALTARIAKRSGGAP